MILAFVSCFAFAFDDFENDVDAFPHCDIREDNVEVWEVANIKMAYQCGESIIDICKDYYPKYSVDDIINILQND